MSTISGWAGNGAGLIVIAVCVIASWFIHRLPKFSHPWIHRALIVLCYCGAVAVLATGMGRFIVRLERDVTGWLGGTATGLGHAALIVACVFLVLTVAAALIWEPVVPVAYLGVGLVFLFALGPGGALHGLYAATAVPGDRLAHSLATWLGG